MTNRKVGKVRPSETSIYMNSSLSPKSSHDAFLDLYNRYADDVFRFCLLRLRDRERALDATQDTFHKLWQEYVKRPEKMASVENLRAFMYKIARNTVIDATRKKSSTPFSFLTDAFSEQDHSAVEPILLVATGLNPEEAGSVSELTQHLDILDPQHREIIIFRYLNDMNIPEIAAVYGISENAASVRLHRAIAHAQQKLAHLL